MLVSPHGRAPRILSLATTFAGAAAIAAAGCSAAPDAAPTGAVAEAALAAWPGPHLAQAHLYVEQINDGDQLNNHYGSPASIAYVSGVLHATTICSTFMTLLMENAYPRVVTPAVIAALTGTSDPDASQWYGGIDPTVAHGSLDGISLVPLDLAATPPTGRTMQDSKARPYLKVGDILAAEYDGTGHVATVASIASPSGPLTLSGTHVIPAVAQVTQWLVEVYDSTDTIHGSVPGSTDSRYDNDPLTSDGNDHGIGSGYFYLYEDATEGSSTHGQLVGWTWSTISATTYQLTSPSAANYRPMVIGRMTGAGL